MPRSARIDTAGVLHHIIVRGIEKRKIFRDDKDREDFIERLSVILPETKTPCYAWALMSNHVHLLLRSGEVGISKVMRRLLTGYAVSFNLKYRRHVNGVRSLVDSCLIFFDWDQSLFLNKF